MALYKKARVAIIAAGFTSPDASWDGPFFHELPARSPDGQQTGTLSITHKANGWAVEFWQDPGTPVSVASFTSPYAALACAQGLRNALALYRYNLGDA